jgi:hypothetical protein
VRQRHDPCNVGCRSDLVDRPLNTCCDVEELRPRSGVGYESCIGGRGPDDGNALLPKDLVRDDGLVENGVVRNYVGP